MRTLGTRIREWRELREMSQADLAEGICTASSISQFENDKASPSIKTLIGIAEKLDVGIEVLVYGGDAERTLEEVKRLIDANKFEKALYQLKSIEQYDHPDLELMNMRAMLNLYLGTAYMKTNFYEEAIKYLDIAYRQIKEENPSDWLQARKILVCLVRCHGHLEKRHGA